MKRIPFHLPQFVFSNESTHCCQKEFVSIARMSIRLYVTQSMKSTSTCPAAFVCRLIFYVESVRESAAGYF